MADRTEIAWVTFIAPARIDSQSSAVPAVAKSPTTSLFKGTWAGESVVFIEDESLRVPGIVPWSNVASFGAVDPPKVEVPPLKKGPFGRPLKAEEPAA